jgi:hypothetical protein
MTLHAHTTLSSTSATRLTPDGIHSGMDITIQNIHESAYVYVGAEDVSASVYGYRIAPDAAFSIELPGVESLYAISSVNNSKVAILQTGLEAGN